MGGRDIMQEFLDKFSDYKECSPPGVRLPNIKIDKKYYEIQFE